MINFPDAPTTGQQFTEGGIAWVWDGVKWTTNASMAAAQGGYVPLTGATMTGPLTLSGDAATPLGAVTKQVVDGINAAKVNKNGDTMSGDLTATTLTPSVGFSCKAGSAGVLGGHTFNLNWTGSGCDLWIDGTRLGKITVT